MSLKSLPEGKDWVAGEGVTEGADTNAGCVSPAGVAARNSLETLGTTALPSAGDDAQN